MPAVHQHVSCVPHVTGTVLICWVFISHQVSVVVQGKKEIAKALRVFVDHDNYPVLVHCIHGKDRTGLIVMLIMLLCSVEPEVTTHSMHGYMSYTLLC